jgi:hypothetical protein
MEGRKVRDNPKPPLKQKGQNMVQNGFNVNIFRKNDAHYLGTLLK